jgi:hypothetical protein
MPGYHAAIVAETVINSKNSHDETLYGPTLWLKHSSTNKPLWYTVPMPCRRVFPKACIERPALLVQNHERDCGKGVQGSPLPEHEVSSSPSSLSQRGLLKEH